MLRVVTAFAVLALAACSDPDQARIQRSMDATDIQVASPLPDARITSPLTASGTADNTWYFEAVFPARLMARDGTMIAEAPAIAASDWTQPGDVRFNVEMAFTVSEETPATLVLEEDMPGEGETPRQVRVPVVLVPES
jgi:hypothetical protein